MNGGPGQRHPHPRVLWHAHSLTHRSLPDPDLLHDAMEQYRSASSRTDFAPDSHGFFGFFWLFWLLWLLWFCSYYTFIILMVVMVVIILVVVMVLIIP